MNAPSPLPPATGPLGAATEDAVVSLFEKSSQAFLVLDRAGHVLRANARFLDCLGWEAGDLAGLGFEQLRHDLPAEPARQWFLRAFEPPGEATGQGLWLRRDGSSVPFRILVQGFRTETGDRLFVWGQDHTEEKLAIDHLMESAGFQRHLAEGIYELSLTRTSAEAFRVLVDRAAAILPGYHWFLGRTGSEERGESVTLASTAFQDRIERLIQGLGLPNPDSGFARELYDHRRLCFVAEAQASPELIHSSISRAHGLSSLLGVPLVFEGRITGVLVGMGFQEELPLPPQDLQLSILQNLARIAALALERIQAETRLEESVGLARNLAAAVKELAAAANEETLVRTLFLWAGRIAPLPEWWFNRYDAVNQMTVTTHWTPGLEAYGGPADICRPVSIAESPLLLGMHLHHRGVHIPRCEGHPDMPDLELWPYRTFIGLPLVHEGQQVGSLSGGSFGNQGHVLVSDDRFAALESLAEAAGLVLNRLHSRRAMETEETRFRLLFEQAPDPILLIADGLIVDTNASASQLFGRERGAMIGRPMSAFSPEYQPGGDSSAESCGMRMEAALSGTHQRFEWTFLDAGGKEANCQVDFTRLEHEDQLIIHASVRDLTDQKQSDQNRTALERQLFQAQKMESLGVLAGGIAHDFNNLLMGVLGHSGLALEQLKLDHPIRRNLEAIQKAGMRAADLTRQMLAYSGRGQFVVRNLDLSTQVEEMLHLLEVSIPKTVALNLELRKGLPPISADASQIQQVIMNLVINAAESIGEELGAISIATGVQQLDERALGRMLVGQEAAPGTYVYLEVTDTGCGMDADTLSRIFEPFFTTKFTGRGLGLSALMGIVRGHQGALSVTSDVGLGTAFKVLFPAHGTSPEPEVAPGLEAARVGRGLILVVDDEETVREVARRALEPKGYQVLEAQDGRMALALLKQHAGAIGLVLLDMTMPRMGGEEAFHEMRQIQPDLRVILSSGYHEAEAMSRFMGKGLKGFIQKPYGPRELVAKVQEVLTASE